MADLELSAHQRQLWRVERAIRNEPYLHTGPILRLTGHVQPVVLQHAARAAVRCHELLRAGFTREGDELRVTPTAPELTLTVTELAPVDFADEARLASTVTELHHRPFAFDGTGLVRFALVTDGVDNHVLVITLHRLVCDAASIRLLVDDVALAASGIDPEPGTPYSSSVVAGDAERLDVDRQYWTQQLERYPVVTLGDRQLNGDWDPDPCILDLPMAGLFEALTEHGTRLRATPFALLAGRLFHTLAERTGSTDLCVGISFENRMGAGLGRLVGPMAEVFLLRLPSVADSVEAVVDQVKATLSDAIKHRRLPFDEALGIVVASGVEQDTMLPVGLAVKAPRAPWPRIADTSVTTLELDVEEPLLVRPGQLDVEVRLDAGTSQVHVLYDGAYMTEAYVRDLVERMCTSR